MKFLYKIKSYMSVDAITFAIAMATMNGSLEDYIALTKMEEK